MMGRQPDREGAAVAEPTGRGDLAAVGVDDLPTDRDAKTRPDARDLGREARREELAEVLLRDAGSGVLDLDPHRRAVHSGPEPDGALGLDGLDGIDDEVHEHLVDLAGVALHGRGLRELLDDPDAVLVQMAGEDLGAPEPLPEVDGVPLRLVQAREGPQVLHDDGYPAARLGVDVSELSEGG